VKDKYVKTKSIIYFWHIIHCVSKNDTDVPQYNFDADQPILINYGW